MFSSSIDSTGEKMEVEFDEDDDEDSDTEEESVPPEDNLREYDINERIEGLVMHRTRNRTVGNAESSGVDLGNALVRRKTRKERIQSEINHVEVPEDIENEDAKQRLRERICQSHKIRLVALSKKKSMQLKDNA